MSDRDAPNAADDAVGQVVESFLERFRKGERPALTELVARHPELADELREIIPALVELEQLGGSTGSLSGSTAGAGASSIEGEPSREPGRLQDPQARSAAGAWASSTRPSTSRSRAGWR